MKRQWMVMLTWLVVATLLVGLWPQEVVAAVNLQPRAVFSLHPFLEEVTQPPPPAALVPKAPVPVGARAGPLELLAHPCMLFRQRDVRPPSWETRGPPGPAQGPLVNGRAAVEAGGQKARTVPIPDGPPLSQRGGMPHKGVLQQPLVRPTAPTA